MFRLDGKVALVTGGSRGIGRACCEALAEQGATVIVNYVKGEAAAREVADAIAAKGGKAEIPGFDVADTKAVDAAVDDIAKRHGSLDILVANAGISIDGLLLRLKDEDLDRLFATNVKGALACARACSRRHDARQPGPHRLHVERRRRDGQRRADGLRRLKAALIGAAKSIAREYASRNITVNVVAPGFIDTDMTRDDDRRDEGAAREDHPARPHRHGARRRGRVRVPRQRRGRLRHGPGAPRERRHVRLKRALRRRGELAGMTREAPCYAPLPLDSGRRFSDTRRGISMATGHPQRGQAHHQGAARRRREGHQARVQFIDDLGADSLGLVELVLAFEEAFEIDIPDEDTEKIRTVQDAIDYIEKHAKK